MEIQSLIIAYMVDILPKINCPTLKHPGGCTLNMGVCGVLSEPLGQPQISPRHDTSLLVISIGSVPLISTQSFYSHSYL